MMGLWIHFGSVAVLVTSWINPGWMDGWMADWIMKIFKKKKSRKVQEVSDQCLL